MRGPIVPGLVLLGLVLGTPATGAAEATAATAAGRHAGIVVSVDASARRLVLEEMSPGIQVRRIAVEVEPDTALVEIVRTPEEVVVDRTPTTVEIASTGRYVERALDLATLKPGDFVVVELKGRPAAGRPVPADRVELTARADAASASGSSPAR